MANDEWAQKAARHRDMEKELESDAIRRYRLLGVEVPEKRYVRWQLRCALRVDFTFYSQEVNVSTNFMKANLG